MGIPFDIFNKDKKEKQIEEVVQKKLDNLFYSQSNMTNMMNYWNQVAPIQAVIGSLQLNAKLPNKWIMLNLWANYFGNLFELDGDKKIFPLIRFAIRNAFMFGSIYLVKDKYEWKVAFKSDKKKKYKIIPLNAKFSTELDKDNLEEIHCEDEDTIFYQYDSWGIGGLIILDYWLEYERNFYKIFNSQTTIIADKLKFFHNPDNSPQRNQELVNKYMSNDDIAFGATDKDTTIVSAIAHTDNNTQNIIAFFEYVKNYWYELLGRRTNLNQDSRSNAKEEDARNDSFTILERDKKEHLEAFLMEVSEKLHCDIKVKEVKTNEGVVDKNGVDQSNRQATNKDN